MELNNDYKNYTPNINKINTFLIQDLHGVYKTVINPQSIEKNKKTSELEKKTKKLNELLKKSMETFEDSEDDSIPSPKGELIINEEKTMIQGVNELNRQSIDDADEQIEDEHNINNEPIENITKETKKENNIIVSSTKDDDYCYVGDIDSDWQEINIFEIGNLIKQIQPK